MTSTLEIARVDHNRMFEFFYSKIKHDGTPHLIGIRAIYGFGPDSFGRFRALMASLSGPFIQLAKDTSGSNRSIRPRDVAHKHPIYGWGCATIREFMGYMSDSKVLPPKGQLFLTLLPRPPGTGQNGAWEEVYYMNARRNPGRETLQPTALEKSYLPEGMGSNRMIVIAIDLQRYASGISPVSYRPAGYYALKDNTISLSCMPIAYFMDNCSIFFNTRFQVGPKFGAGPAKGEERNLWPIAKHSCPVCGALFPAGLHICHSCSKPIHYPDGIFYADLKDVFDVEYYGVHAELFYRLIESDTLTEYRPHTYAAIKQLQNFPASRSLAEDHRKTEFFGSNQCDSVHGCHYEAGRGGTLQEECSRYAAGCDPIGHVR